MAQQAALQRSPLQIAVEGDADELAALVHGGAAVVTRV
jgi:hypothetical protein